MQIDHKKQSHLPLIFSENINWARDLFAFKKSL